MIKSAFLLLKRIENKNLQAHRRKLFLKDVYFAARNCLIDNFLRMTNGKITITGFLSKFEVFLNRFLNLRFLIRLTNKSNRSIAAF